MNVRIIKNYDPSKITKEFLYNTNDWDLIELNYNINSTKLKQWWDTVLEKFPHMIFDFNTHFEKLELEKTPFKDALKLTKVYTNVKYKNCKYNPQLYNLIKSYLS